MASWGVRTPSDSGECSRDQHSPTHVVGEAYAYVQGASLKAYAVFLSEGFSTPRSPGRRGPMKHAIGCLFALITTTAYAQPQQFSRSVTDVDLKAAYCLAVDRHLLSLIESLASDPTVKNYEIVHSDARRRWERVREFVMLRTSEGVDVNAILLANRRAEEDLILIENHPDDKETTARVQACSDSSWLPY
jgi:hypothetical protein